MRNNIYFLSTIIILLSFYLIYSRDISKDSVASLDTLVVTGSKVLQSSGNVTQKIDIVSSKEISTMVAGKRNICEVIQHLPGASVSVLSRNDANWGTYSGIGPKYSTYMLQGLPVDAFVDPMSLDLNAFERLEIQRGPASVLYPNYLSQDFAGNQIPLGGSINFILKEKITQPETHILTSYGYYNTLNGQIFHQNKVDRLNYFTGSTYEMSDYVNYGDTSGSWLNMKKSPAYKKTKAYGGITLFIDSAETHKLSIFGQQTWHSGDAGRVYRGYNNNYKTINASYSVALNEIVKLQSGLGIRTYDRLSQESNFGTVDTLKSNNGVHQTIVPFDISLVWKHLNFSSLIFGADYQNANYETWSDPLQGYRSYGNKSRAMQAGVYAQEELRPIKNLTIRAGMRYAYVKNIIELVNGSMPGDTSVKYNAVLGSIGIKYTFLNMITAYANGGNSFSPPGLKSSGGTIRLDDRVNNGQLPNPDLKPESGYGTDAGIDVKLPMNLRLGMRGFYNLMKDQIVDVVVSQNPSQSQSINAGNSKTMGAEIELSSKINENISWFINYTYLKTLIESSENQDQDGAQIPFAPDGVGNLGINVKAPFGLTFVPYVNYKGVMYDATSKSSRNSFRQGFLFNAHISQQIIRDEIYSIEWFGQFYNITNNKFKMPWQFQDPGFSAMGGLKITFLRK